MLTSRDVSNFLMQIQLLSFMYVKLHLRLLDSGSTQKRWSFAKHLLNQMLNFAIYSLKIIMSFHIQCFQLNMLGLRQNSLIYITSVSPEEEYLHTH